MKGDQMMAMGMPKAAVLGGPKAVKKAAVKKAAKKAVAKAVVKKAAKKKY